MKKILFATIPLISLLLMVGCGSSSNKDDNKERSSVDNVLEKSEVAFNAPKEIDFSNKTNMRLKRVKRTYTKIFKKEKRAFKESYSCDISGEYSLDKDNKGTSYLSYKECIYTDDVTGLMVYIDGTLSVSRDETTIKFIDYMEIPDINYETTGSYMNLEISMTTKGSIEAFFFDGVMENYEYDKMVEGMTFSKLILKTNSLNKSWFIKGGFSYKAGCLNENHIYDTDSDNWLVEHDSNPNFWKSGTLYVDSFAYKYSGTSVSVSKGDKRGTFTQQELLDEIENKKSSDSCSTSKVNKIAF